jgi:hypothetical protein
MGGFEALGEILIVLYRAMIRLRILIPPHGNWIYSHDQVRKKALAHAEHLIKPYSEPHLTFELNERMSDGYLNPRQGWASLAAFGGPPSECGQAR